MSNWWEPLVGIVKFPQNLDILPNMTPQTPASTSRKPTVGQTVGASGLLRLFDGVLMSVILMLLPRRCCTNGSPGPASGQHSRQERCDVGSQVACRVKISAEVRDADTYQLW